MTDATAVTGRPSRSPAFPALDLSSAIQRAEVLYRAERQNAVPIEVAVKHWGYKSPNGRSNLIVSALKKYGLIVDSGTGRARKIQVTDATRRILEHPNAAERTAMIQKAALLPRIHNEMWKKFGASGMPSDDAWAWELKEDLEFTDSGAVDFIKEYKETIRFAQLGDEELEEPEDGEEVDDEEDDLGGAPDESLPAGYQFPDVAAQQIAQANRERAQREAALLASNPELETFKVPMPRGESVTVQGTFPLTERGWTQLMAFFEFSKPVLVDEPDDPED